MEIVNSNYSVKYDAENHIVVCSGSFRLTGSEYAEVTKILDAATEAQHDNLTLDLSELKFLNSSGINTLSKFIIRLRKHNASHVTVKGNSEYAWQRKSLVNFQKLLPALELEFD